ncbi:MAG: MATE family efflux transporter, partial [Acidimicrobiales bacterium]
MTYRGDEKSPRHIWRRVISIGLPSLGTVLLEPVLTSTDTAIIGHVSATALGALSLAASALSLVVVPFTSLSFAVTTEASATRARGPREAVGALGVRVWWGFGIMGVGLGLLLCVLAPFVGLVAPNPEVGRGAEIYLWISCFSMPALCATQGAGSYLTGISRTSTVLLISLGTAVFNVAVEVILVFGVHLSVAGSATGTAIAQVIAALLGRAAIGRADVVSHGRLRDAWSYLRDSMEVGRALVVRTLALTGAISGAVIVASLLSVATLGGFQVGQQAWLVFGLTFDAIAVPAQVLIAEWHARGLDDHIAPWGRRLLLVGLVSSVLLGAVMILARG